MREAADAQGWFDDDDACGSKPMKGQLSLRDLLDAFAGEADAVLARTPHYLRTDELARKGRARRVPPRDVLIAALRADGFAATRSHIDPRGLKTNAAMAEVIACANRACEAIDEAEGRA
jgi:tRNA (guanine26-N2/guanine27-N2)-dimethyltransferase